MIDLDKKEREKFSSRTLKREKEEEKSSLCSLPSTPESSTSALTPQPHIFPDSRDRKGQEHSFLAQQAGLPLASCQRVSSPDAMEARAADLLAGDAHYDIGGISGCSSPFDRSFPSSRDCVDLTEALCDTESHSVTDAAHHDTEALAEGSSPSGSSSPPLFGDHGFSAALCGSVTDNVSRAKPQAKPRPKAKSYPVDDEEFVMWWAQAPKGRKVGPAEAYKAYWKARKTGASAADLLAGIMRDAAVWAEWPKDQLQYIPYPATWLNQARWAGDPPVGKNAFKSRKNGGIAMFEKVLEATRNGTLDEVWEKTKQKYGSLIDGLDDRSPEDSTEWSYPGKASPNYYSSSRGRSAGNSR